MSSTLPPSAWLPLLRGSLRELKHASTYHLRVDEALQSTTMLQSLAAQSLAFAPGAELPPSLARLTTGSLG